MESFDYKDSFVAVRRYQTGKLPKDLVRDCYCCHKDINDCRAVLLINNHKYIPNVLAHEECFDVRQNKTELFEEIEDAYATFQHLRSTFNY